LVTFCFPMLCLSLGFVSNGDHSKSVSDTKFKKRVCWLSLCCVVSNVISVPVRMGVGFATGQGWWYFLHALLLFYSTPAITTFTDNNAPELYKWIGESLYPYIFKEGERGHAFFVWQASAWFIRFLIWFSLVVVLCWETENGLQLGITLQDRCFSWCIAVAMVVPLRLDLLTLIGPLSVSPCSATFSAVCLIMELIYHTVQGYSGHHAVATWPHELHVWFAFVSFISLLVPGLLDRSFREEKTLMWKPDCDTSTVKSVLVLLLSPLYLIFDYPTGFQSLMEIIDISGFLIVLKSISDSNLDTDVWRYDQLTRWQWDILPALQALLALQLIVWALPVVYLAARGDPSTDQQSYREKYKKHTIFFVMLAEAITDVPELALMSLWSGWQGTDHNGIIVTVVVWDIVMTVKGIVFVPIVHLCDVS